MKKSNMILGYAEYNGDNYPFVYENWKLNLLPATEQKWNRNKLNLIDEINEEYESEKSAKWIENVNIKGITNEGENIVFISDGIEGNNNGFIQYDVKVIYKYQGNSINSGLIKGLTIKAEEIDYFFDPTRVFENKINFNKKDRINSFIVESNSSSNNTKDCGKYNTKSFSVNIKVSSHAKLSMGSYKPLSSQSRMSFEFDKLVSLDEALKVINHQQSFLQYISYRKNISIKSIDTFRVNEKGLREKEGEISVIDSNIYESNKKKSEQILTLELLEGNIVPIFQSLADEEIYLSHLCECINSKNVYDMSRIILLFTAFESEYEVFFGSIIIRSDKYFKVKKDVLDLLKEYKKTCSRKEKKYIGSFEFAMDLTDRNLNSCLTKVVKDNMEIMKMFLIKEYKAYDNGLINDMSQRLSSMRNHIAHGNLNFEIKPINISDLNILEILIYTIRLSSLGISKISIKRGICELKGYKIFIPDDTANEDINDNEIEDTKI